MGVKFVSASSTLIRNTAARIVSTGYPFSMGCWFNWQNASTGHNAIIAVTSTSANNAGYVQIDSGAAGLVISNQVATGANFTAGNALPTVGIWNYCIARFISATNYRLSWLNGAVSGTTTRINHVQGTTSKIQASLDTFALGAWTNAGAATQPADAIVAEAWWTGTDIQPDGGQLSDNLVYQLAFGGPFSVPSMAKDIIEYRSLRQHIITGTPGLDVYSNVGPTTWTASATLPTIGGHPPLPYYYKSKADVSKPIVM